GRVTLGGTPDRLPRPAKPARQTRHARGTPALFVWPMRRPTRSTMKFRVGLPVLPLLRQRGAPMCARRVAMAALVIVALVGVCAARAAEVVDAADAANHVGTIVTVEGDVAVARSETDGLVLELAPVGPTGFRAVLVWSLISSLPRAPERIY